MTTETQSTNQKITHHVDSVILNDPELSQLIESAQRDLDDAAEATMWPAIAYWQKHTDPANQNIIISVRLEDPVWKVHTFVNYTIAELASDFLEFLMLKLWGNLLERRSWKLIQNRTEADPDAAEVIVP